MSVQECVDNYYNLDYSKINLNNYLYKIVDNDGKKVNSDCRFNRIWRDWMNNDKKGIKLYAYTKDLKPSCFLLAWK